MKFFAIATCLAVLIEPSFQKDVATRRRRVQVDPLSHGSKGSKGYPTSSPNPSKGKGGKGSKGYPTASPTVSPTISSAPTICRDNPDRFLVPGTGGNDMRTCEWVSRVVGDSVIPWRCRAYPEALANCRLTCGDCTTEVPSVGPSPSPSAGPTPSPSADPTVDPTAGPSDAPSDLPSDTPSSFPTPSPTASPTKNPTLLPTTSPTLSPTVSPTVSPTEFPSSGPSGSPTPAPSSGPTDSPTFEPSFSPTITPTASPTVSPTSEPSCAPTKMPTASPSKGKGGKGKGGKGKGTIGCTSPTPAPTPPPTPCQDSTERFPVNNVTQSCEWVVNGGGPFERGAVPWRCGAFPEAAAACKLTCGACGCQDSSVRFPVNNVTQSCEWVARTDTEARCMMDGLRFYCPVTCGLCEIELF